MKKSNHAPPFPAPYLPTTNTASPQFNINSLNNSQHSSPLTPLSNYHANAKQYQSQNRQHAQQYTRHGAAATTSTTHPLKQIHYRTTTTQANSSKLNCPNLKSIKNSQASKTHSSNVVPRILRRKRKNSSTEKSGGVSLTSQLAVAASTLLNSMTTTTPKKKVTSSTVKSKPPYSYQALIEMAINSSHGNRMTLRDIYDWIEQRFEYFKTAKPGWKNSIRYVTISYFLKTAIVVLNSIIYAYFII